MCKSVTPIILSFFLALTGCVKKNPVTLLTEPVFCRQIIDSYGKSLQEVCNKTETEIKANYTNPCSYYKNSGEKFCW